MSKNQESAPTWNDLLKFIESKVKEDPNFLQNRIMIECVDPKHVSNGGGWKIKKDHDQWTYVAPAWTTFGNEGIRVLSTTFKKDNIVTLNINY